MKLNAIERALVNNPVRAWVQRHYEAPLLTKLGGGLAGATVLEMGCGRGIGAGIILDQFGARRVDAFDLDPRQVARARQRLSRYPADRLRLSVADATAVPVADSSYDAVFDFGIIHHVPEWRRAVAEVYRLLRPGGRFYFEEVSRHGLQRLSYRLLFEHPQEDRFSTSEFVAELEGQGIAVGTNVVERFFGDFFMGVGRRRASDTA
jgi:ubiquinone/menaquinone biosynthesis C-methylase UbiE